MTASNLLPTGTAVARTTSVAQARSRMRPVDREFLPAALEIIETPPSPVSRTMILTICLFAVIALAWSYVGTLDIIAVAQGKFQPIGQVKTVQAFETSHVRSIEAQNGIHVNAGDVLVRLDSRSTSADRIATDAELASYRAETIRRTAAIALARSRQTAPLPALTWPDTIPPAMRLNEEQVLRSDVAQLESQVASLQAQVVQKRAEGERLTSTVVAETDLMRTLQQRVDMRNELVAKHVGSKASLIDAMETLQQQKTALARDAGQMAEIQATIAALRQDVRRAFDTFAADNAQRYVEASRKVDTLSQKLVLDEVRNGAMTLRSPTDGVVQALTLTSVGQVVSPGEELMRIVPDGNRIEVECYLPNRDIGFVREGQTAVLKVEAFPFTEYGTIKARIVRIGHDAIPTPDAQKTEEDPSRGTRDAIRGGAKRMQNLMFPVTLAPERTGVMVDGQEVPIQPGMSVTAEIKTGQRRILQYLVGPVLQVGSEALHER